MTAALVIAIVYGAVLTALLARTEVVLHMYRIRNRALARDLRDAKRNTADTEWRNTWTAGS